MLIIAMHSSAKVEARGIEDHIIGGTLAVKGEFPYIASIQISQKHICGGFIYNSKWIVTAASCVYGYVIVLNMNDDHLYCKNA